jgi:hypothetical protein
MSIASQAGCIEQIARGECRGNESHIEVLFIGERGALKIEQDGHVGGKAVGHHQVVAAGAIEVAGDQCNWSRPPRLIRWPVCRG